jgi:hypothetical protein
MPNNAMRTPENKLPTSSERVLTTRRRRWGGRQRRADWRKRELAASRFRAKCDYLDGTVATSSPGQVP